MIKMVVSSFYNTILDDEEAIPTSTMLEIERVRKKGIIFTICTNRNYKHVLEYNKDFPFIDYIVSLNGGYVYDVVKGKCLSKKKITAKIVSKIHGLFPDKEITYYTEEEQLTAYEQINDQEIYKIEFKIDGQEEEEKIKKVLSKTSVNITKFYYNNNLYLEITSNLVSMFTGVDKISLKNNFELKNIVSICGNESDIPLVQNIEKSYIVKNAPKILGKYNKRRTESNDLKGVENVLKKIKS